MSVLGLRFCARAFSSCGKWGPLFIAARGPLTIAASLVAEHRLQTHRLSSCGSRAQLLRGMWDLPRPGLESMSPALAGRFPTTVPPGKPPVWLLISWKTTTSSLAKWRREHLAQAHELVTKPLWFSKHLDKNVNMYSTDILKGDFNLYWIKDQ